MDLILFKIHFILYLNLIIDNLGQINFQTEVVLRGISSMSQLEVDNFLNYISNILIEEKSLNIY